MAVPSTNLNIALLCQDSQHHPTFAPRKGCVLQIAQKLAECRAGGTPLASQSADLEAHQCGKYWYSNLAHPPRDSLAGAYWALETLSCNAKDCDLPRDPAA